MGIGHLISRENLRTKELNSLAIITMALVLWNPQGRIWRLGKLGAMLGFAEDKLFTKDNWHYSGEVNINHGWKYVKIMVDIAESNSVFDEKGKRSNIITTLPVETQQSLLSTRTVYTEINSRVPIVLVV